MGGRIYDAALGRMLQADPFVQDPTNTQSFNRYIYVFNNPLSYTDPSGYFSLRTLVGIVVGVALTIWLGPLGADIFTKGCAAFIGGFASGAIITGSLKGALISGITAMATAAIFQGTDNFFTKAPAVNAGTGAASGGAGDVIFKTSFSGANPTVGGVSASNVAVGGVAASTGNQTASSVSASIAGEATKDAVVKLANVVVTGTPITIRQIISEALFYQSLTEITRDMIEASFEGYATDTNMATVNAFRLSSNALQEAYAIVAKEIRIRQFQTAFLINTVNVVSLASGAGATVRGVYALGKGVVSKLIKKGIVNPSGNFYSVAHQMKLPSNLYPGGTYSQHFAAANKSLVSSLDKASLKFLNIEFHTTKSGAIIWARSPKNWTWHHDIGEGIMQLVPRIQHMSGSIFQNVLHPGGKGGMSLWNKIL